jgi:aromatic ring-opening dioxygenase catalytic subunit (LigB family)
MSIGGDKERRKDRMAPVHLFSHGSTMMLGEEHSSANYWKKCGDEALANGVKHVIIMVRNSLTVYIPQCCIADSSALQGAHWATSNSGILVSTNPKPAMSPVAYVHPSKYKSYPLNADVDFAPTIMAHLREAGIPVAGDANFNWIHDTFLVLVRMFPEACPPTTILSMNGLYDPHFHAAVGAALRPLRSRDDTDNTTLFIGSGGAVHNLYRNVWGPMVRYRDNFAQPTPPEPWALDFRQELVDVFCPGYEAAVPRDKAVYGRGDIRCLKGAGGPMLRRKAISLMKHPRYRDAHATDDHFMATMFVAGLCGAKDDEGLIGVMGAEDWELTNMCNTQFTLGSWHG